MANIQHFKNFIDDIEAIELFDYLQNNLQWIKSPLSPNSRLIYQYCGENLPFYN